MGSRHSTFEQFLSELELKRPERQDAEGKADRIARSLFAKYYPNQAFDPSSYIKVGSYGKGTATRPRTDLDMLFVLPRNVYMRIEGLAGNKQSQLPQEVRRALLVTFPNTEIGADGQAVVAPFQTYNVDIVPACHFISGEFAGQYLIADTTDGGRWRHSNPVAEYNWLRQIDAVSAGKATHLIRMLKAWKRECNVEIKSMSKRSTSRLRGSLEHAPRSSRYPQRSSKEQGRCCPLADPQGQFADLFPGIGIGTSQCLRRDVLSNRMSLITVNPPLALILGHESLLNGAFHFQLDSAHCDLIFAAAAR